MHTTRFKFEAIHWGEKFPCFSVLWKIVDPPPTRYFILHLGKRVQICTVHWSSAQKITTWAVCYNPFNTERNKIDDKISKLFLLINIYQCETKPVVDLFFFFRIHLGRLSKCYLSIENAPLWSGFWNSYGFLSSKYQY